MRNKYYFCELNVDGDIIRKNMKVEQTAEQKLGKTDKQVIEETWGCRVISMKKSTKFNYDNGQF